MVALAVRCGAGAPKGGPSVMDDMDDFPGVPATRDKAPVRVNEKTDCVDSVES